MEGHLFPCIKVTRSLRSCNTVTVVRCDVGRSLNLHFIWGWHKSWLVSHFSIRNPHERLINFAMRFTKYKHSPVFCRITNTHTHARALAQAYALRHVYDIWLCVMCMCDVLVNVNTANRILQKWRTVNGTCAWFDVSVSGFIKQKLSFISPWHESP